MARPKKITNDITPMYPAELTDEVREKAVLALTGTTAPQIRGSMGNLAGSRCALGVVLEGLGFQLQMELRCVSNTYDSTGAPVYGWCAQMRSEDVPAIHAMLPNRFMEFLVYANDKNHHTFDQIAKGVKEWTPPKTSISALACLGFVYTGPAPTESNGGK